MKKLNEIAEQIEGKKVALYGAGKYGEIAKHNICLLYENVEIKCFIDDNKIRNSEPVEGISIYTIDEALELEQDFIIIIANFYVNEVLKRLENANFDLGKVYFWSALLIENISEKVITEHKNDFKEISNLLCDYKSKMIYRTLIECHNNGNMDVLNRTCDDIQYFPIDVFQPVQNEIFVDGGAFDGDTIRQFIHFCNNDFQKIYAFEPDFTNFGRLKSNLQDKRINMYNGGLFNYTGKLNFAGDKGGSSRIDENGKNTIHVFSLDAMELPDEKITFVKMDIEGSELCALHGMERIITAYKPRLAICIYHKFEDLWEIPLYIKSLVPEYKLYIRNYTTYLDEVVLYATL